MTKVDKAAHNFEKELDINPELTPAQRKQMLNHLRRFSDLMVWDVSDLEATDVYEHQIELVHDEQIHVPPYRQSPKQREILDPEIAKLLMLGIIE